MIIFGPLFITFQVINIFAETKAVIKFLIHMVYEKPRIGHFLDSPIPEPSSRRGGSWRARRSRWTTGTTWTARKFPDGSKNFTTKHILTKVVNEQTFAQHELMKANVTDEMKVWRKMYLSLLSCLNISLIVEINCMMCLDSARVWNDPRFSIKLDKCFDWKKFKGSPRNLRGIAPKTAKEKSNLFYIKQSLCSLKLNINCEGHLLYCI